MMTGGRVSTTDNQDFSLPTTSGWMSEVVKLVAMDICELTPCIAICNLGGGRKAINSLQLLCPLSCYYYHITGLTDCLHWITYPALCLFYSLYFAVPLFLHVSSSFLAFQK